jgi:hypothetical protein
LDRRLRHTKKASAGTVGIRDGGRFEACMMRTAQVLLEGYYNGIFEPWKHYIPIKKDCSNLDQVFAASADH